jgi:hypothetical protein
MSTFLAERPIAAPLPDARLWRVDVEIVGFVALLSRCRERVTGKVVWRICPHGGYFLDERASGYPAVNAYMTIPHSCPHGPSGRCARAYREQLMLHD